MHWTRYFGQYSIMQAKFNHIDTERYVQPMSLCTGCTGWPERAENLMVDLISPRRIRRTCRDISQLFPLAVEEPHTRAINATEIVLHAK